MTVTSIVAVLSQRPAVMTAMGLPREPVGETGARPVAARRGATSTEMFLDLH
jgi:hypothetical protein